MKDKWDMLVLGDAVPAAGAELESIYPTKTQNPCEHEGIEARVRASGTLALRRRHITAGAVSF